MAAKDEDMDFHNRFSRQNAALGAETTMRMVKMKALIVGVRGVGIEVAKNLVLQGLGGVTLCDPGPVEISDLGTNFFLRESDVGKPCAEVVVPKLRELNPFCEVKEISQDLTEAVIKGYSVLVICSPLPLSELTRWNEFCRACTPKVSFIVVKTGGVYGSVFVDHGNSHIVHDANGENPMVRLVVDIEKGEDALCRLAVPDGQAPGSFEPGAFVEFTNVIGMDGIMTAEAETKTGERVVAREVKPSHKGDPVNTIRIGDTRNFSAYSSGGIVTEKKVGTLASFKSLAEAMKNPGTPFVDMTGTDMVNFGMELQVHVAQHAVFAFQEKSGKLPVTDDIDAVVEHAKKLLSEKASEVDIDLDEDVVKQIAAQCAFECQPMCAFLGGVVAQEVVKCTGKFTPIPGFLHFHAREALPKEPPQDNKPIGSRYDGLIILYGKAFVEKLQNLNYFMVGCGALGCEFLKNFALCGVCCGADGLLTVTDADRIELSNLSRQFLFREHNVGQPKSRAAGVMAVEMNPAFKVKSMEMFVGAKTEDTFNDEFWTSLSGVCNALDNMEARFYVDAQCVKYELSLLESGTMGPSGNVDPVVPHKTRTYRDGGEAAEGGGIPMCTLRNFPHLPDHCIEWSRDQFEVLFVKSLKQLSKFKEDPESFCSGLEETSDEAQAIIEVRGLLSLLAAVKSPSLMAAAQVALDHFHFLFRDKIKDLITAFPADARNVDPDTKQDKGPFWSGHKKFPTVAVFDANNKTHADFLAAATAIIAGNIGVVPWKQEADSTYLSELRAERWATETLAKLKVSEYVQGAVNMEGDDTQGGKSTSSKETLHKLVAELRGYADITVGKVEEADFEKDDDLNFHILFITAAANLRADNYTIPNSDFHKVKLIAGRIIPAIATTTASVCGLVMFELFKVALGMDADSLRNRQIGLAVNNFTAFEADPPKTFTSGVEVIKPNVQELPPEAFNDQGGVKEEFFEKEPYAAVPEKHSVWTKLVVPSGDMKLSEFKSWLIEEHKLELKNWAFVIGWKRDEDEDGKEMKVPVSVPVSHA
jgi:ubiquitin-activating enzyme E1